MNLGRRAARIVEAHEGLTDAPIVGLVASAARVEIKQTAASRKRKTLQADWQAEAWHHYNRCGELQYGAAWLANSLSRIRLYAAKVGEDGRPGDPTTNPVAQAIAANLFGGPGEAAQVLAALGVHLTVPGDCYIVNEETADSDDDDWYVISTSELVKKNNKLGIDRGDGWRELDEAKTVLIRVWNPHPQKREEATSATRAILPILRELEKLDAHVMATLESRLAGAGVLFVPDTIQFKSANPEAEAANPGVDPFVVMLTEAMMSAVEDRESASALVPLLAKVPEAALDKIQHLTFGTELNAVIKEAREECIRRLALGMDMPPEELLGKGNSSHWASWQIEEGGIKVHIEPKAVTICSALTETYFRPALEAAGVDSPEDYVLWYDVSELVLRPNRGDSAKSLYELDELGRGVLLRENGFDPETDAPSADERREKLLVKLLLAAPEALGPAILPALGITNIAGLGGGAQPAALPAVSGRDEPPADGAPATGDDSDAGSPAQAGKGQEHSLRLAREIAVEGLVSRGLEFAGKRLLTRGRRGLFGDVDVRTMYLQEGVAVGHDDVTRLLDGAWAYLAEVAEQVSLDPVKLQRHLTDHVGGLLTTGLAHERIYSRTIVRLSA